MIGLTLLGIGIIGGMFKGRDMCVSYAQNIACDEKVCEVCEEFDLSYCPTCMPHIITEPCPLEPDPLSDPYILDLEQRFAKAMDLIKTQQAIINIQDKLKDLE